MATLASSQAGGQRGHRFFLTSAFVMTATVFVGFSVQLAAGRSSFEAPPLVHAHALVFMGWVVLYVLQNIFADRRSMTLHRRLGWLATGWMAAMVVLGCAVTVAMVRRGGVPFFFAPLQFLVLDPVAILTFAGLTTAAIVLRRQTEWHRRLHFCGMAVLLDPAIGRLIPAPSLVPWTFEISMVLVLLYPAVGIVLERRRTGRVHPAWWWGIGAIVGSVLLVDAITYSPVGIALYDAVTQGSPGAAVAPLAYPPPPHHP